MSISTDILLETENLTRTFDGEVILTDVSLAFPAGTVTAIIGPSGSGKTTLLGLLSLLLDPTSGEILIRGREVNTLGDGDRARLRNEFFGYVFQAAHLVGSLSAFDNVLIPAWLAGQGGPKRREARALLERLGLGHRLNHLPHQLSVGQKRRVALARALIMDPPVILADEPTNDLDPERARQIADELLALADRGRAVVLVTHDEALASRVDNRWRLDRGRLEPILLAA